MADYRIINGVEWYMDINRKSAPSWPGWTEIDVLKKNGILDIDAADTCRELQYLYYKFLEKEHTTS